MSLRSRSPLFVLALGAALGGAISHAAAAQTGKPAGRATASVAITQPSAIRPDSSRTPRPTSTPASASTGTRAGTIVAPGTSADRARTVAVGQGNSAPAARRTAAPRRHRIVRHRAIAAAAVVPPPGGEMLTLAFDDAGREPTVPCAALRACTIDLEPGEQLVGTGPLMGDTERWMYGRVPGVEGGANTIVWVKASDCDLTSNLIVPTDRRVYRLTVDSGPCGSDKETNPQGRYASRVVFTYPTSPVTRAAKVPGVTPANLADARTSVYFAGGSSLSNGSAGFSTALAGIPVDATKLSFDYVVRKDKRFPWAPGHVFDDGSHTFIKLPPEADAYAAPALFEIDEAGGKTLLNYTVRDGYYVTDRTFRRAALVTGQGKQEQRVDLENRAFGRTAAASNGSPSRARGAPGGAP